MSKIPTEWNCSKSSKNFIFCKPNSNDTKYTGKEIEFKLFSIINEKDTYFFKDDEKGNQMISISRSYLSDNIEIEYFINLNEEGQKKIEISLNEAINLINSQACPKFSVEF